MMDVTYLYPKLRCGPRPEDAHVGGELRLEEPATGPGKARWQACGGLEQVMKMHVDEHQFDHIN